MPAPLHTTSYHSIPVLPALVLLSFGPNTHARTESELLVTSCVRTELPSAVILGAVRDVVVQLRDVTGEVQGLLRGTDSAWWNPGNPGWNWL